MVSGQRATLESAICHNGICVPQCSVPTGPEVININIPILPNSASSTEREMMTGQHTGVPQSKHSAFNWSSASGPRPLWVLHSRGEYCDLEKGYNMTVLIAQVRFSQVDGGGEGLYARRNLAKGEIVAFYNGVSASLSSSLNSWTGLEIAKLHLHHHHLNHPYSIPDPTSTWTSGRNARELGDFWIQDFCKHRRGR